MVRILGDCVVVHIWDGKSDNYSYQSYHLKYGLRQRLRPPYARTRCSLRATNAWTPLTLEKKRNASPLVFQEPKTLLEYKHFKPYTPLNP